MSLHITAVVPAFNTARYISESLNSIIHQPYKNFDILVVDDGSTDETADIVRSYMRLHPCVSLISYSKHKNVTHATAVGIKHARGPIVTIVDSDDRILNNAFVLMAPIFDDPEVGFAWSKFLLSNGNYGWSKGIPKDRTLWDMMTRRGWWKASHHKFFRLETYNKTHGLNSRFDRSSDYQLVLLLASTFCKTVHVPEPTYWYRMSRPGSLTRQGPERQRQEATAIRQWMIKEVKRNEGTC